MAKPRAGRSHWQALCPPAWPLTAPQKKPRVQTAPELPNRRRGAGMPVVNGALIQSLKCPAKTETGKPGLRVDFMASAIITV